ncbi:PorP/SprF family type IX secretion system membrane protein [Reichenbachiella versicolor]|uniref:PorP/SprF family type IX secretion system membrane protein n=1 Tax=Reichenbachiella versicolor TaxID=1821036 RepID=UPI000D6E410A|nr:PorP/SprF family type IX secretion system membrane protein [Reichenbachiella versicolor]
MKVQILFLTIMLASINLAAQQYPNTQLYYANPYLINPGFTGYLTDMSAYVNAMSPMTTEKSAIRNYRAGINQALEKKYLGVGGKFTYDQRDFFESLYLDLSLAYKLVLKRKHVIGLGTDIGIVNRSYNITGLTKYVDQNDPTLTSDYFYRTNLKIGVGMAYYSTSMELGIAFPHMVESSENFAPYFNTYVAYKYYLPRSLWLLKPALYFVNLSDGTQIVNGNLMFIKKQKIWLQLGYGSSKEVSTAIGLFFDMYELSYSYVHSLSDVLPYNSLNELMLRIHIGKSNKLLSHIADKKNRK